MKEKLYRSVKCMLKVLALSVLAAFDAVAATPIDDSDWRGGPTDAWFVNWGKALAEARKTKKKLFVLSTGSDWCHWCKRLKEDVLDKPEFKEFAMRNLVLVYIDNPRRSPLCKDQKTHNKLIVSTLPFDSGVPCASVFTSTGRKLGMITGGGMTVDDYLGRLKRILKDKGEGVSGNDAKMMFKDGGYQKQFAKAVAESAKAEAERAKIPPAPKEAFKAKITGVAVATFNRGGQYDGVEFKPLLTPLVVPFGKAAVFRVEYDLPKGYGAYLWIRWPSAKWNDYCRNLGFSPSGLNYGKGIIYRCLKLSKSGKACRLTSVSIDTNADPVLEGLTRGWEISETAVDLNFLDKDGLSASSSSYN